MILHLQRRTTASIGGHHDGEVFDGGGGENVTSPIRRKRRVLAILGGDLGEAPQVLGEQGGVQVQRPVERAVAAADDDDVLPGVGGELLDHVRQSAALTLAAARQGPRREGAGAGGW